MKKSSNYLDIVPVHQDKLVWEKVDDGTVVLYIENNGFYNRAAQLLFNKPRISHIHLDEMGSHIWIMINGENTVYDIAVSIKDRFGEKAEPLFDRLIKFLSILKDQGFIKY